MSEEAQAESAAVADRPQPLRDLIRRKLIEAAVKKKIPRAKAEAVLAQMESERPLIDWLTNGGLLALVKLFLELLT